MEWFVGTRFGYQYVADGNIVKKPTIWLPAIISSAVMGPISTMIFKFQNNAVGSGMGTAGLVGPINAYHVMVETGLEPALAILEILLLCFVLPGLLAWGVASLMRKMKWLKPGDMRLES